MAQAGGESRLAVADLGSNSFRLVVFGSHPAAPETLGGWWKRTDEIYEPVRIGAGVDESGALGEEGIGRAIATIDVFAHFCRAAGLEPGAIDVVATSAIREASNSAAFLERAQSVSGLSVRVLSGEEEGRYGYLAAVNSTGLHDGVVLDLGGGSMQLTRVHARAAVALESWRLGAVRMTERFLPGDKPASAKQLGRLREHVERKLERAPWLADGGGTLVGIGGTVRNLAAAAQRESGVPEFGVQGYRLEARALEALIERLAGLTASERRRVPGIKPARGDIILAGAVVVQTVLGASGLGAIDVTEAGLREGIFFERLLDGADPPLFEDVRRAAVENLAAQYDPHAAHTRHVAHLALTLFDDLARAGLHEGDGAERELLWASSLLHDVGVAVDYDDHHKHSRYLVQNAGLPGFSPREVALIGQIVRYHRKGSPGPGPFGALLRDGDGGLLDRCSVLLRLAEDLERSRDQLVREVRARLQDDVVRVELDADGDARVPRWAAARETELFDRAFGRPLEIV